MSRVSFRALLRDGPALAVAATVVAWIGMLVAAVGSAVLLAVVAALGGERSEEKLAAAAQSTAATWVMLLATQLVSVVVVLAACRIAGIRVRERLGLARTTVRGLDFAAIVVATIVPFALGLLAASGVAQVLGTPDDNPLMRMWTEGSRPASVLWVLCIAIVPGVVEESFYRGFVQRTLLLHWRPASAIALSSALFAIAHGTPTAAAFTFVVGAWFGTVAWRTGSVALPILLHALMNGSWTALQMLVARSSVADQTWTIAAGVACAVGLVAFVPALRILRRCAPAASDSTTTAWPTSGVLGRAGVATLAAACVLYAVIPPGATAPEPPRAPSSASLRERATRTVSCPLDGEVELVLVDDQPVRIELPPGVSRVTEALVALDDRAGVIWLAYDGEVSGKGNAGIPRRGIVEQLVGGEPARLRVRFGDATVRPLTAWVSLLGDEQQIEAALAQAAAEEGWATRGRAPESAPSGER